MFARNLLTFTFGLILFGAAQQNANANIGQSWNAGNSAQVVKNVRLNNAQVRVLRVKTNECINGYKDQLEVKGHITRQLANAVEQLIPSASGCVDARGVTVATPVYLDSMGGDVSAGYKLGMLFNKNGFETRIFSNDKCMSSCAIAFLGGKTRSMQNNAEILFHTPYRTVGNQIDCSDRGQITKMQRYYNKTLAAGQAAFAFEQTLNHCSQSSGWTLNAAQAERFGITTATI